jgi:ethanolamine ammonia-lyase small subunit
MAIDLRSFTAARVGLQRQGSSLSTSELLRFDLDHARARDAVHLELDPTSLGFDHILVRSEAKDRRTYLLRPDLGRRLQDKLQPCECDATIIVADGLSALAVHRHAKELLTRLLPLLDSWKLAPLIVATQARVAIGDDIGEQLGAKLALVLIGERPGLTSPDSLGTYLTYNPKTGRNDAERNCVSNIRPEGLSYDAAAHLIHFLMTESRARKISGVTLKSDATPHPLLDAGSNP